MMKYSAFAALLGVAAASQETFFNDFQATEFGHLRAGVCQQLVDGYLYDLGPFDRAHRDEKAKEPATVDFDDFTFLYKVCQNDYTIPETYTAGDVCAAKNTGYLIEGGECKYTFGHPDFLAFTEPDAETGKMDFKKFTLTYSSDQNCTEGEAGQKVTFEIEGFCPDENSNAQDNIKTEKVDGCTFKQTLKGKSACLKRIHLSGAVELAGKFIGVILIVNGVCMAFAGSKYLFLALASLIFFGVSGLIFGLVSNMGLITMTSPKGLVIGLTVASGVVGALCAYFGYQLAQAYAASIVSGAVGACIAIMLTGGVKNKMVKLGIIFVAIFAGIYIGKMYNKYVKSIGTAVIGATMLVVGIAQYDPAAPEIFASGSIKSDDGEDVFDLDEIKSDKKVAGRWIAYIGGWVVVTGLGSFIQLKYVASDDEDDDDMMNKDFA